LRIDAKSLTPGVYFPKSDGSASFSGMQPGSWTLSFAAIQADKGTKKGAGKPDAVPVHEDGTVFLVHDDLENGFTCRFDVKDKPVKLNIQGMFSPQAITFGKCC
jgi:hypothetical protein